MNEAQAHPHNQQRGVFIEVQGVTQPAPAPRFSVTAAKTPTMPGTAGSDGDELLQSIGYDKERIADLRRSGVIA